MAQAFIQESTLTAIADALRIRRRTADTFLPSQMAAAIADIPDDSGSDVNFYDYDGTLMHAYTQAEALALAEMPQLPDHTADNLTADGWNYTLAQMQAHVADYGRLDIGAVYHTTDGAMHLTFEGDADHLEAAIHLQATVAGAVTVDWGDGSAVETWAGTSAERKTHTYAAAGTYDVKVACSDGSFSLPSYICGTKTVTGVDGTTAVVTANLDGAYTHIFLPASLTSLGANCFNNCSSLRSVTLPASLTSLGNCFYFCSSLRSVTLPASLTSLGANCFNNCYSLRSVTLPASLTSLGTNCFASCTILKEYHFLPATPPTLAAADALTVGDGTSIYVPTGSLSDYQTASVWSAWAAKMAGE